MLYIVTIFFSKGFFLEDLSSKFFESGRISDSKKLPSQISERIPDIRYSISGFTIRCVPTNYTLNYS